MSHKRLLVLVLLVMLTTMSAVPILGQDEIVLKVAVPAFLKDIVADELVERYEADNPGVRVQVIASATNFGYNPGGSVEDYLDNVEGYASEADILTISSNQIAPEATRAGYFLNLNPLISTDAGFDESDFLPALLDSFRWDNGTWALPISADVIAMIYDPAAFDAAGQEYPSGSWTLDDLENAISALTQYDDEGNVSKAALLNLGNTYQILHSLLGGTPLFDATVQPISPSLNNPQLEDLLTRWVELQEEGLLTPADGGSFDFTSPMLIGQSLIATSQQLGDERQIALLPGGRTALLVNGVAVSTGTRYPEEAYKLAKYITSSPEIAAASFGITPARRSLVGIETDGPLSIITNIPDELRPAIEEALANATPASDALFASFIEVALEKMQADGVDAQIALQDTEVEALERLQAADERATTAFVSVATPIPDAQLSGGEVAIKFGIVSFLPEIPNRERWDQMVDDFTASDSEVAQVTLDVKIPFPSASLDALTTDYDCFYMPNNVIQGADLSLLRSMDPLMASDLNFSQNDFAGNLLDRVRRDNQVWAMPLNIQPLVLWYDPQIFQQNGAQPPFEGWTVSDFENVLRTLKINPADDAPFVPRNNGDSSHLLALIAAYGGLPLDYRTQPVTIDFTNPATVDAIQQVLNLAKDGYIEYQPLASAGGNIAFGAPESVAMYSQLLNNLAFLGSEDDDADSPYRLSTFPQGTQFSAVSYDMGAAYISANTPAIEACYRFISILSNTPDLFESVMPARRSQINAPELVTAQGQEAADFYGAMDRLLQQPNTILIPSTFQAASDLSTIGDLLITVWLNRAFDHYVLEDADLLTELEDAQLFASSYQGCAAAIPPAGPDDNIINYLGQFIDCAVQIDPSIASLFPQFAN